MLLGELPGGDGLRTVGLPAGTGQVVLDLGRKDAQSDHEHQPAQGDHPRVSGDPGTESAEGTGVQGVVGRGAVWVGGSCGGHGRLHQAWIEVGVSE